MEVELMVELELVVEEKQEVEEETLAQAAWPGQWLFQG